MKSKNPHIGSTLDDFLKEEGIFEEVDARARKRVLALEIQDLMRKQRITKTVMASRMETSRASVDRLLDPDNKSVTLETLNRAAHAVGRRLRISLEKA